MATIEIHGLSKRFGDVTAVDDLSFTAREGAVTGFLGPNGAGKSTTLRMLLGLVSPTGGSATIDGNRYADLHEPFRCIGAMLETDAFHPGRRACDHLRILAAAVGLPATRVDAVLEEVDLADVGRRRVKGFSLGMRQRLGLASALLGDPKVLILDEPANGLDPEGVRWLRQFVRSFADRGGTVLISSHVLAEVAQTVDDVVIIAGGRLVVQSSLVDLANRSRPGVRVRTPQVKALHDALNNRGIRAQLVADDALVALDSTPEQLGLIAAGIGAVIYEMTAEHFNLEEMYLELTAAKGALR
ncbi:MAG: ABC transporter ATP-binding protein [Ilumatobacteraceae bacterium]